MAQAIRIGCNRQTYTSFDRRTRSDTPWYNPDNNRLGLSNNDAQRLYGTIFGAFDRRLQNLLEPTGNQFLVLDPSSLDIEFDYWSREILTGELGVALTLFPLSPQVLVEMVFALGYVYSELHRSGSRLRTLTDWALRHHGGNPNFKLRLPSPGHWTTTYHYFADGYGLQLSTADTLKVVPSFAVRNELRLSDPVSDHDVNPVREVSQYNNEFSFYQDILGLDLLLGTEWTKCPLLWTRFDPGAHALWDLLNQHGIYLPCFVNPLPSALSMHSWPPPYLELTECYREYSHPYLTIPHREVTVPTSTARLQEKLRTKEDADRRRDEQIASLTAYQGKDQREKREMQANIDTLQADLAIVGKDHSLIRQRELASSVRARDKIEGVPSSEATTRLIVVGNIAAHAANLERDVVVCAEELVDRPDEQEQDRLRRRENCEVLRTGLLNLYGLTHDHLSLIVYARRDNIKLPHHSVLTRFLEAHYWYQQVLEKRISASAVKVEDTTKARLSQGVHILRTIAEMLSKNDEACFDISTAAQGTFRTLARGIDGEHPLPYPTRNDFRLLQDIVETHISDQQSAQNQYVMILPVNWIPSQDDFNPYPSTPPETPATQTRAS